MSAYPDDPTSSADSDPSSEDEPTPAHLTGLLRHFVDLRDRTHGGSVSRRDKEERFASEVELLSPTCIQVLREMNDHLLFNSGTVNESGIGRLADGGVGAAWELSWPEQREVGISPVGLYAFYGAGFHHPHLRGATVHDWPLNLFSMQDSSDQLPILRAIATSDLHNLVFQADFRIIPAVMRPPTEPARSM
jgi:hypothetical protein